MLESRILQVAAISSPSHLAGVRYLIDTLSGRRVGYGVA